VRTNGFVTQAAVGQPVVVTGTDGAAGSFDIRLGGSGEAAAIGQLLHDFNREFDEPTPSPAELAARIRLLLDAGDTVVILGGTGPDGLAVLRFRLSIWSAGLECYLAELYVVPERRGLGLGRALMETAIEEARRRGADHMDLGTSESDTAARHLYEALGFINRENGATGPIMYVYEREI
jgi:ribosomal protein S18 acetylase RimI-like enzyme